MSRRVHEHLVEDRRDEVAVLRVDREERLGALSRGMVEAIGGYLDEIAADASVRVLVITGTGRGFIAGADIAEYDGADLETFVDYQRLGRRVSTRLAELPQATIAAINGHALGGGLELALCCDLRIAADSARMGLPEIKLGLVPGGSGTQRLPRIIGASAALDLLWSGRSVTAEEAHRLGILSRPPEPGDGLRNAAETLAREIAAASPGAVQAAKTLVRDAMRLPIDAGWTLEQSVLANLFTSSDAKEGIRAFREKRAPNFDTETA